MGVSAAAENHSVTELLTNVASAGGWTAVFGALLWFIDRRLPKGRSQQEERDAAMASMRATIEHQTGQIGDLEKDVAALRKEVRHASVRAYKLTVAIQNYIIDYPHSAEWWAKKLKDADADVL